jgi:hypothetical protein
LIDGFFILPKVQVYIAELPSKKKSKGISGADAES